MRILRRHKWSWSALEGLPCLVALALAGLGAGALDARAQSSGFQQLISDAAAKLEGLSVQQPSIGDAQTGGQGAARDRVEVAQEDEALPAPRFEGRLPLAGPQPSDDLQISQNKDGLITLIVRDKSLSQVLALLAQTQGLNIVASNDIDALISITLRDVPLEDALTAILSVTNYTWVKRNNIILITSLTSATNLPANVQGRQIEVFELDFAAASAVAEAVTGFLSPIGRVTVTTTNPSDNRMTREMVVVEDLPQSIARIAEYIYQVDQPPRQVLIEAHILQVTLDDTNRCGVDLDALARISNSNLTLKTTGFSDPSASPAFLATLEGGDLGSVIELLQSTTDAKSLGSPKLLVLNEQEARLQVGETIYYTQTTTFETSSQQGAASIDTGVILGITPRITRDGRVLLHVEPEVSSAGNRQSPELPPDTSMTRLHTDVMLEDGQGMVIGGLIKETDSVTQSKVPWLGDVKGVGWFFRRSEVTKERVEIIVALVPRILPYDAEYQAFEQGEIVRAGVPLLHGPLCRTDRPWDPVLPDGKRVTKPLIPPKKRPARGHYHNLGPQYVVPPYPLPKQNFYGAPCDEPSAYPTVPEAMLPAPELREWSSDAVQIITDQP